MAAWEQARWESPFESGLARRDRAQGAYRTYLPDPLVGAPFQLSAATDAVIARAERAVANLVGDPHDLAGVARFLLRSEAVSSSRIEGLAPSVRQVALAELGATERVPQVGEVAQHVANNMIVVEAARTTLVVSPTVDVEHLVALHAALLPEKPDLHGVRSVQSWIGGSDYHPINAEFVPPAPQRVPEFLDDLVTYLNGAAHSPIVQAGLVHAQFETIHPFADGNGRVGRALIHTVLTRRGLTPSAVLPVSLVLSTLRSQYVAGLNAYRHAQPIGSAAFHDARTAWLEVFAAAVLAAAAQAASLAVELAGLRAEWDERLTYARSARGKARSVRSDSAAALILRELPGSPVLSNTTVQRIHGVSHVAAVRALEELTAAGILAPHNLSGQVFYQARDVLDLITSTERRLASTRFDTRLSPPARPVPAAMDEITKPS